MTVHTGVFTLQTIINDLCFSNQNSKSRCKDDQEYLFDKISWSLIFAEMSLDYDDTLDKLILERHTLQCWQSNAFCKPALKHPYTIVSFPDGTRLIIQIFHFVDV